jgi:hypothetical protein
MIRLKEHVDIENFTFDMSDVEDAVKTEIESFIYHILCRNGPQLWIDTGKMESKKDIQELQVQIHIDAFCQDGQDGFVFEENYFEPLRDAIRSLTNTCGFDGDIEEGEISKVIYIRDQLVQEAEFINKYVEEQIAIINKKEKL